MALSAPWARYQLHSPLLGWVPEPTVFFFAYSMLEDVIPYFSLQLPSMTLMRTLFFLNSLPFQYSFGFITQRDGVIVCPSS